MFVIAAALAMHAAAVAARELPDASVQARAAEHTDVARWLGTLSSPRASERARAERELAVALTERDLDALRACAKSGEAEVRRRLSAALSSSDRHLGLAASLATDPADEIADVGRAALREMLARWSPGYSDPAMDRAEVRTKLRERSEALLALDSSPRAGLALALDELARAAAGAPPLVLDPDLAASGARAFHANSDLEGGVDRVLDGFARAYSVAYFGYAMADELGDAARPWILVTGKSDDERRTASERVIDWCLAVATETNGAVSEKKRTASARALAALDWPAAAEWLERRWLASRDPSALDALVLAAGRGRVAAALADARVQADLYADMDAALAKHDDEDDARAEAIARALSAAGTNDPRGEDTTQIALSKSALSPREAWMRLVVLEGSRSTSPLVVRFIDALIARPPSELPAERAALRFQALRTRAACARGARIAEAPPDLDALFTWAAEKRELDELVHCLAVAGARPPETWLDPAHAPLASKSANRLDLAAAVVRWCIDTIDSADSGASSKAPHGEDLFAALLASRELAPTATESLAAAVRRASQERDPALVERFLSRAHGSSHADADALDRFEVIARVAPAEVEERVLAAATSSSRADLMCLAACAASRAGEKVRLALVSAIARPAVPRDVVDALDRALAELRAARVEKDERAFVGAVREAGRAADAKLKALLRADAWPAPPKGEVVRVAELDRHLRTSGL